MGWYDTLTPPPRFRLFHRTTYIPLKKIEAFLLDAPQLRMNKNILWIRNSACTVSPHGRKHERTEKNPVCGVKVFKKKLVCGVKVIYYKMATIRAEYGASLLLPQTVMTGTKIIIFFAVQLYLGTPVLDMLFRNPFFLFKIRCVQNKYKYKL